MSPSSCITLINLFFLSFSLYDYRFFSIVSYFALSSNSPILLIRCLPILLVMSFAEEERGACPPMVGTKSRPLVALAVVALCNNEKSDKNKYNFEINLRMV